MKTDHYRPYGTRAKLGIIVPPTNTVNEAEWARMMPEGVTLHAMRMALHADTASPEGKRKLHDDIRGATLELAKAHVDVIVYACTAGSMVQPLDSLTDFMTDVAKVPAVATAPALVHAVRAFGLRRVAIATPYHDALNEHEVHFLADSGIETTSIKGLGIGAGGPHEYINIARTPKEQVYSHCRAADVPSAEGMIISCTDFATLEALPQLERELAKPVISSNLATFWLALRTAGVRDRIAGYGRLLEEH